MASPRLIAMLLVLSSATYSLAIPTSIAPPQTKTIRVCCPDRNLTYSEEWNYFNVRKDANMFYWLYSQQPKADEKSDNKPWFLWLQGGPGMSGTGTGNFDELGPFDFNMNPRNTTWLSRGDLLFVDSPVGSGFSYVTNDNAYTTTVDEVANDLIDFMIHFMSIHPEYQNRPFYLWGECYGTKMATVAAWHLYQAIQQGKLKMNFKGVGLDETFVSPIDFVDTWPDYLYNFGRLTPDGLKQAKNQAAICDNLMQKQQWTDAHQCFLEMEDKVSQLAGNVSLYNVMKQGGEDPWSGPATFVKPTYNKFDQQLTNLMNGPIKKQLSIPKNVVWESLSTTAYNKHSADFMKPVTETIDTLLSSTNLTVFITAGQFDVLVDAAGVYRWMSRSKWASMQRFQASPRQEIHNKFGNKEMIAHVQNYKNLYLYSMLKAGHLTPGDVPVATLGMLDMFISI